MEKQAKKYYPLTDAQNTLRLAELSGIEKKASKEGNIIAFCIKLDENKIIDADKMAICLEKALNEIIYNNDALRIKIVKTIKGIRQYIKDYEYQTIERIVVDGQRGLDKFLENISQYKLDWFDDNLVFAKILVLSDHQCAIAIRIHHAVFDGYSIDLFCRQFKEAYLEFIEDREPKKQDKLYSITEYFDDIASYNGTKQYKEDLAYWFKKYNKQRKYSFPVGRRSLFGACDSSDIIIDGDLYNDLVNVSQELNCSLPSLCSTLVAITTYVLTKKENFCVYTISHGRRKYGLRKTIGCMMNNVPVFYDLDNLDEPLCKFIKENFTNYMEAYSHARFPSIKQIVLSYKEAVLNKFNFNHGWMMFSWMNYESVFEDTSDGIRISDIPQLNQQFQLYVAMLEVPKEKIKVEIQYQTHKFNKIQVEKMLETFAKVCKEITSNSTINARELVNKLGK